MSDLVGPHPWADETGRIDARRAGTWMANLILTAGGMPSRAFRCAAAVAEDIEQHPDQFKSGLDAVTQAVTESAQ